MNLATLVGILATGFALFFLGNAIDTCYKLFEENFQRDFEWKEGLYLIFSSIFLGISIALILRKNWARTGMYVILLILLIIFTLFLISTGRDIKLRPFNFFGLAAGCYGLIFFGLYILSNEYFLYHFNSEIPSKEETPDILDSDF